MTASPEYLPDDFAAAIKAADDYADALDTLRRHDLPKPFNAWVTEQFTGGTESVVVLRQAIRTFGGRS